MSKLFGTELTKEQQKFLEPLETIQDNYAKQVLEFLKSLPYEQRQVALYESMDVAYALAYRIEKEKAKIT